MKKIPVEYKYKRDQSYIMEDPQLNVSVKDYVAIISGKQETDYLLFEVHYSQWEKIKAEAKKRQSDEVELWISYNTGEEANGRSRKLHTVFKRFVEMGKIRMGPLEPEAYDIAHNILLSFENYQLSKAIEAQGIEILAKRMLTSQRPTRFKRAGAKKLEEAVRRQVKFKWVVESETHSRHTNPFYKAFKDMKKEDAALNVDVTDTKDAPITVKVVTDLDRENNHQFQLMKASGGTLKVEKVDKFSIRFASKDTKEQNEIQTQVLARYSTRGTADDSWVLNFLVMYRWDRQKTFPYIRSAEMLQEIEKYLGTERKETKHSKAGLCSVEGGTTPSSSHHQ
eukprot:GHVS01070090.1.p1 GENE.GHVS01070090.1~~GHVS01070090.1.p1  ORF type:complete len:338 (+),score=36.24 GHVS01070090.1:134-1147(+)